MPKRVPASVTVTLPVPARDDIEEEARETISMLRGCRQAINLVVVALAGGVELEVWADGALRRRARFVRDSQARKYSRRLTARLARRGYREGRGTS